MRVKLSLAQFSSQDYVGFLETRTQILTAKVDEARSWGPCAVAAHLLGDHATALTMMEYFVSSTRSNLPPHELSELLFYQAAILHDSGDAAATLAFLQREEPSFVEKRRWREETVRALLKLGREDEAAPLALQLLDINSEDARYAALYLQARRAASLEERMAVYGELQKRFPRSAAARRAPLDVLPAADPRFREAFQTHYRGLVEKGAPSCFASVLSLYGDADKVRVIEEQVLADLESLRREGSFAGRAEKPGPTALLWQLYFAGQHYDRLGRWSEALALLDEALRHTPTLIDVYVVKARVAKHMGEREAAFLLADRARELDTADRWLNSHCVRYALAADHPAEADARLGYFAKAEDGMNNVFEMQNQRYMLDLGRSHLRSGRVPAALKILAHLVAVYDALVSDHHELLRYSMGAATVGAWYEMGVYLRTSRSNRYCVEAVRLIVDTYLALYESGVAPKPPAPVPKNTRSLLFLKNDPDPLGEVLAAQEPLAQAHKYAQQLVRGAPDSLVAHALAGRVAVARGKLVQALTHLSRAHALGGAERPETFALATAILAAAPGSKLGPGLVEKTGARLLGGCATAEAFVAAWRAKPFASELPHVEELLETELRVLRRSGAAQLTLPRLAVRFGDVATCLRVLDLLRRRYTAAAGHLAEPFAAECVKVFPHCVAFGGTECPLLRVAPETPAPAAAPEEQ
jgi:tetratricopeptide (TPR) repeat protein